MSTRKMSQSTMTTQTLAYCALLAALSVVLSRLVIPMPSEFTRFSIGLVPIFLASVLFGPVPGALVGFTADLVGCLFSGYGYNPIFCVSPILCGVLPGLFRHYLSRGVNLPKLLLAYFPSMALGSVLYMSAAMGWVYGGDKGFMGMFLSQLVSRSIQYAITLPVDAVLTYLLFRANIFERMGLWPLKKEPAMTPEEAISYIHAHYWKDSVPGLERTQELLRRIGNPEQKLKYVHIAGTNGKGSTAAMTASILAQAGYRVGLFTSPYIYRFHERMQVNGRQISDQDLVAVTEFVKPHADAMAQHPTEFELVSCIGFEYFARQNCDIVVLEVGMGGALDSTNVIPCPEVAVITNIGLDHTDSLGDTVEKIAVTKAGIFKEGGHAVVYRGTPGVEAVFEQVCAEKNVQLKKADFDSLYLHSHSLEGQVFDCGHRKELTLPLLGDHQLHNAAVVLSIVDTLIELGWEISEEHIRQGLATVTWPGRFDIAGHDPLFIIDGGHNPQCIEALVKNVEDYLSGRRVIALTGVLADKDYGDMYRPIMDKVAEFVCVTPDNPRRMPAAELAEHLQKAGAIATPCDTVAEGVKLATEKAGADGVVLCFGSLYTIGAIRDAL